MHLMLLSAFIFIISCGKEAELHLSDMKNSLTKPSEIILFDNGMNFLSSDSLHNLIPPHGTIAKERVVWNRENEICFHLGNYKFCNENDWLNTRLKLYVIAGDHRIEANPLGGSCFNILYRLLGSPPATLQAIIQFEKKTYGLLHTYGFTLFRNGKFCQPIKTNPNGKISFGMDAQNTPLIFTSGTWTKSDISIEGWKEYEISSLCQ